MNEKTADKKKKKLEIILVKPKGKKFKTKMSEKMRLAILLVGLESPKLVMVNDLWKKVFPFVTTKIKTKKKTLGYIQGEKG